MLKSGPLRGEKVQYPDDEGEPDAIGCCIWYPFPDSDDTGIAFDFPFEDIDDLISLLQEMKTAEPEIYKPEDDADAL